MKLESFQEIFDKKITNYLEGKIKEVKKISKFEYLDISFKAILKISMGGKRYRPYLTYSSYTKAGGKKDIWDKLIAIELLHVFALIHDDIIDNAKVRHGTDTIQNVFSKVFESSNLQFNKNTVANNIAILCGDLVFAWSVELFQKQKGAENLFAKNIEEVVLGQIVDVSLIAKDFKTQKEERKYILEKMTLKTAHYSIMYPLLIGVNLANKKSVYDENILKKMGHNLGIAYQIQDDIFDCISNEDNMEKNILNDIKYGQKTFISNYLQYDINYKDKFNKYFNKSNLTKNDKLSIEKILKDSKVIDYTKVEMSKFYQKALNCALKFDKKEDQNFWTDIINQIIKRTK